MERAIEKEVIVDAPIDDVWAAWTTRAGVVSFLAPDAEIDARVGGAFHIHFNPAAPAGLKGADTMRYMALQPKKMLSFDWNAPPSLPRVRDQRTFVVLRFAAINTQTRVKLHHTGWGDRDGVDGEQWDEACRYFEQAWDVVFMHLQKRFAAGGGPVDWARLLRQMTAARPG